MSGEFKSELDFDGVLFVVKSAKGSKVTLEVYENGVPALDVDLLQDKAESLASTIYSACQFARGKL